MNIEILSPDRLATWCDLVDIPSEARPALAEMAAAISANAGLLQSFETFYTQTALGGEWHREWSPLPFDPQVQAHLGERASLFYLLAYIAALPTTWQNYQRLGIGMDIFKATMLDFRCYMEDYYDLRGVWGYQQFPWIWRHLACELFRLGRLQYMLKPFDGGVTAFRRRTGDLPGLSDLPGLDVVILADPNQRLRADGYADGAGLLNGEDAPASMDAWFPGFEATPQGWRGHPVAPDGWVHKSPLFLPASEWEIVLQNGDLVLDLHIPRKDPLNAQTCGTSYAQALEFFARLFPDRPFKALYCHTWMFSPQLQRFLPPESNLVKFQREFTLYPHAGNVGFLWNFVFGEKYPNPATAPRDTSLRRAVLDWLAAGGEIFDLPGLMFHGPEAWGTQPYHR